MKGIFKSYGKFWWVPIIFVLVLINVFAAQFHKRLDLTNEKRFTISSSTKKILRNLESSVEIDVFKRWFACRI